MALLRSAKPVASANHEPACRHLTKADPVLARLIDRIGRCSLAPRRGLFLTLCDSIISQQLSPAAADTIYRRFCALVPGSRPTPAFVSRVPLARLRAVGVSPQKAAYLKALASAVRRRHLDARRLSGLDNEEIIAALVAVKGIGRWTAEMFLIFALNRPDVLPVDDLGIRKAVQRWYGLGTLPAPRTLQRIAQRWRPYESIACWYLWRSLKVEGAQRRSERS
ncbi:MAG TPA: DNA-3-methyladenine glycosylase [Nitrospirales bacterium]|nr:DNA-3-methyladenine glycosylase [Nitrospirales bacterium]